jgi:hypothetical protein
MNPVKHTHTAQKLIQAIMLKIQDLQDQSATNIYAYPYRHVAHISRDTENRADATNACTCMHTYKIFMGPWHHAHDEDAHAGIYLNVQPWACIRA